MGVWIIGIWYFSWMKSSQSLKIPSSFLFSLFSWMPLFQMQINLEEFADLCTAIGLRFQKEDSVSPFTLSITVWRLYQRILHALFSIAAANLRSMSKFLSFSSIWEVERLRPWRYVWVHNSVRSPCQSCCCYYWNYGINQTLYNF